MEATLVTRSSEEKCFPALRDRKYIRNAACQTVEQSVMSHDETRLSYQEEESAKQEEEQYGSRKVRVVHDVLVDTSERIQHCHRLPELVSLSAVYRLLMRVPTLPLMCPKLTPSSSSNGGSPS